MEIVSKPMHQLGIELPDEEALIERLIDLTSCHPNLVQWLCDRLVSAADTRRITLEDVETVAAAPEFKEYLVEIAWGAASSLEKVISLLMAGPTFEFAELLDALGRYGFSNRSLVEDAVRMLQIQAFLERKGQSYRFVLSHFPHIVREIKNVPTEVKALLSQVEA